METHLQIPLRCISSQFKSYYVVWKHDKVLSFLIVHPRFKSYYVVWKLQMTVIENIAQAKFKSYYVVWKPNKPKPRKISGFEV